METWNFNKLFKNYLTIKTDFYATPTYKKTGKRMKVLIASLINGKSLAHAESC